MSVMSTAVPEVHIKRNTQARRYYTPDQWLDHRSIIQHLYCTRSMSLQNVILALSGIGFHVTVKMLKCRLSAWGFTNRVNENEMQTAMRLLRDHPSTQPPNFRIRGRVFSHAKILHYIQRTQMVDPMIWIKDLRDEEFIPSPFVELLSAQEQGSEAQASERVGFDCKTGAGDDDDQCDTATDSGYGGSLMDGSSDFRSGLNRGGLVETHPEDLTESALYLCTFEALYMAAYRYGQAKEYDRLSLSLQQISLIFTRMCTVKDSFMVLSLVDMLTWLVGHANESTAVCIVEACSRVAFENYQTRNPVWTLLEMITAAVRGKQNEIQQSFTEFRAVWHELQISFPHNRSHKRCSPESGQDIHEYEEGSENRPAHLSHHSNDNCSVCLASLNRIRKWACHPLMPSDKVYHGYVTCSTIFNMLRDLNEHAIVHRDEETQTCDGCNRKDLRDAPPERPLKRSASGAGNSLSEFYAKMKAIKRPNSNTRLDSAESTTWPGNGQDAFQGPFVSAQDSEAQLEGRRARAAPEAAAPQKPRAIQRLDTLETLSPPASPKLIQDSPKPSISSIGERSFLASMDSDELVQEWESDLDPILRLLRSKLITDLVTSFIQARGQDQPAQDQPESSTSASGQTASSSQESKSVGNSSNTSVGKHGRSEDDELDDNLEDGSERPNRKKLRRTTKPISLDGRLLACPYCKYDPTRYSERNVEEGNYQGCSLIYLTSIPRLKQHLYRTHKLPDHYCFSCFEIYSSQIHLSAHNRARPSCDPQDPKFLERMTPEQVGEIKRRTPGKGLSDTWFAIFKILFPGAPLPATPFVETVCAAEVQQFIDHFYRQARERLFSLIQSHLQGRMLLESDQQRILDSALESAIAQVVSETGPGANSADGEGEIVALEELNDLPTITGWSLIQPPTIEAPLGEDVRYTSETCGSPPLDLQDYGQDWGELFRRMAAASELPALENCPAFLSGPEDSSDPVEDGSYKVWATREMTD